MIQPIKSQVQEPHISERPLDGKCTRCRTPMHARNQTPWCGPCEQIEIQAAANAERELETTGKGAYHERIPADYVAIGRREVKGVTY